MRDDVCAIYDNNISPSLLMIIIKIIILYFIQIRHTDAFPPTGTLLVPIIFPPYMSIPLQFCLSCFLSKPSHMSGMPNLRKNPFSTDFYRLFESTEKTLIYGRIYRFFLTLLGYYPPPPIALSRSRYSTGKKNRCLDESADFFVLSSATIPPPHTLDSRYFARAE